jgi:hypothetical protein
LALYELCPLKYKLKHIDKLPEPHSPAFARGNTVHKQAADYLEGKLLEPTDEIRNFGTRYFDELKELNPVVEQQWGFTSSWKPTGWFGKDVWLRAVLDALVIYPDATADVIDHKTGKKYGSNEDQMALFATVTFARHPSVKKVTTRLWYLDSGDEDIVEFERTQFPEMKAEWEKRAAYALNAKDFPPRPNDKCRFCPWSASQGGQCRFG